MRALSALSGALAFCLALQSMSAHAQETAAIQVQDLGAEDGIREEVALFSGTTTQVDAASVNIEAAPPLVSGCDLTAATSLMPTTTIADVAKVVSTFVGQGCEVQTQLMGAQGVGAAANGDLTDPELEAARLKAAAVAGAAATPFAQAAAENGQLAVVAAGVGAIETNLTSQLNIQAENGQLAAAGKAWMLTTLGEIVAIAPP
ncbi:MAG: hypothetical protein WBQ94_00020 [Terracidiphilus sp.]